MRGLFRRFARHSAPPAVPAVEGCRLSRRRMLATLGCVSMVLGSPWDRAEAALTLLGAGGAVSTAYEGLVATRARTAQTLTSGNKQYRSRSAHKATDALTTLRVANANFRIITGNSKEVGHAATATVESYLEYPAGTFTRITYAGVNVGNLPAVSASGATSEVGVIVSDALDVSGMGIVAGTTFFIRTLYTSTGGIMYSTVRDSVLGDQLQVQVGTTWTSTDLISTITHNGGTAYAPPIAIIGQTTKASVALYGDSILWGYGDADANDARTGIIARGFPADTLPFVNLASPGARAATILAESPGRSVLFPYCSHMCSNLGINDLVELASLSSATHITNMTAVAAAFPARVRKVLCTLTPDSNDSVDGWITTGNQTAKTGTGDAAPGSRINYNNAVRAGSVPGFASYLEIADALESTRDSGKWAIDAIARSVSDAAATSSSATVTSATAVFTTADVGVGIRINGAGSASGTLASDIASRTNGTTVVLAGNAGTTVTGATAYIGGKTHDAVHPSRKAYTEPAAAGAVDMTKFAYP